MSIEEVIILGARFIGSLPVLRWAFAGALIAILVDFSDLFMMNLIDLGGVRDYQSFDKRGPHFLYIIFHVSGLRWPSMQRK
ncbi:MAG: hypothetical protein Ct9H300mP27_12750 [Chloroflexota bacterium]|nr:MAG: hypothetical protein Ct9H300mP27_12750 [Chloroflexota bacterium]